MRRKASVTLLVIAALIAAGPAAASGGGGGAGGGMSRGRSGADFQDTPSDVSPDDLQRAFSDGLAAVTAQDWRKAMSRFTFVTDNSPQDADAWNYLGYSSRRAGNAKRSESAYKKALKIDPNHPGANEYYGELLLELNRVPEAEQRLAVLQACCATNPVTAQLAGLIAFAKAGKPAAGPAPSTGY